MTTMQEDVDDRFAGIDIDSLLNRTDHRPMTYGRKKALYEAPEFIQRLNGEETVMEGQSLCIECKIRGFPVPTLRWFKDDEQIIDHPRIHVESNGKGGYSLIIDNVHKGDEAAYRCRAENLEGACSSFFFLSVKSKPKSKKKKDQKNSPNRRTVSFPPMFATIVEKVEEEEKQGIELQQLPPSPMTDFYYALTLKGRQSFPTFVGDWAYVNGGHPHKRRTDADTNEDGVDSSPTPDESSSIPNGDHSDPNFQSTNQARLAARRSLRRSDLAARTDAKKQMEKEEVKKRETDEERKLREEKEKKQLEEQKKKEEEMKMDIERKRRAETMRLRKKAREERLQKEQGVDRKSEEKEVVEAKRENEEKKTVEDNGQKEIEKQEKQKQHQDEVKKINDQNRIEEIKKTEQDRKKKEEQDRKTKEENDRKSKAQQDRKTTEEQDSKAKVEQDRKRKEEQDRKAKSELERKTKEEQDRKAKVEQDRKTKEEQDRKAKAELDRKTKEDQDRKSKEEQDRKAKAELDRKSKEDQDRKAKVEQDRKTKEEQDRKAKSELDRKTKEEQDRKAKVEQDRKTKEEQDRKAKVEQDRKTKEEQDKKSKAEQDRKVKEEKDKILKVDQEKKLKEEQDRKTKEEQDRKAKVEQDRKTKEEQDKKSKAEQDRKVKEEKDKILKVDQEKKLKEEQDRKKKEEQERQKKEEEEKRKIEDVKRKEEDIKKKRDAEAIMRKKEEIEKQKNNHTEIKRKQEEIEKQRRLEEEKKKQESIKKIEETTRQKFEAQEEKKKLELKKTIEEEKKRLENESKAAEEAKTQKESVQPATKQGTQKSVLQKFAKHLDSKLEPNVVNSPKVPVTQGFKSNSEKSQGIQQPENNKVELLNKSKLDTAKVPSLGVKNQQDSPTNQTNERKSVLLKVKEAGKDVKSTEKNLDGKEPQSLSRTWQQKVSEDKKRLDESRQKDQNRAEELKQQELKRMEELNQGSKTVVVVKKDEQIQKLTDDKKRLDELRKKDQSRVEELKQKELKLMEELKLGSKTTVVGVVKKGEQSQKEDLKSREQKQIEELRRKEHIQREELRQKELKQREELHKKEEKQKEELNRKKEIEELRRKEQLQREELRQRELKQREELHKKEEKQKEELNRKKEIEELRRKEQLQREELRQKELKQREELHKKEEKQKEELNRKKEIKTREELKRKEDLSLKEDIKLKANIKSNENLNVKEEFKLKKQVKPEDNKKQETKWKPPELRNKLDAQAKESLQTEQLKANERKQVDELKRKEEKQLADLRHKQEKDDLRRELKKEQMIKDQLWRQHEEEVHQRQQKEQEAKERRERNKQTVLDSSKDDEFQVKVYKRDYSFEDLRTSLQAHFSGEVINADEVKYWDDILEKQKYSISDLKQVFDSVSQANAERQSRSKDRKSNTEDADIARMRRAGSVSGARQAFSQPPEPANKRSESQKRQKDEEIPKKGANISDIRQQFLEIVKSQSSSKKSPSLPGHREADITINRLKVENAQIHGEAGRRSKSPTPFRLSPSPSPSTASTTEQEPRPTTRKQIELSKIESNVAAKRASFYEQLYQKPGAPTKGIALDAAQKRKSFQGRDAYGSIEIPTYKRAAGWSDDLEKSLDIPKTDEQQAPGPKKVPAVEKSSSSVETSSRSSLKEAPEMEDSSTVRPFVYNSARTIARTGSTGSLTTESCDDSSDDDDVFSDQINDISVDEDDDETDGRSPRKKPLFYIADAAEVAECGNAESAPAESIIVFNSKLRKQQETATGSDFENSENNNMLPDRGKEILDNEKYISEFKETDLDNVHDVMKADVCHEPKSNRKLETVFTDNKTVDTSNFDVTVKQKESYTFVQHPPCLHLDIGTKQEKETEAKQYQTGKRTDSFEKEGLPQGGTRLEQQTGFKPLSTNQSTSLRSNKGDITPPIIIEFCDDDDASTSHLPPIHMLQLIQKAPTLLTTKTNKLTAEYSREEREPTPFFKGEDITIKDKTPSSSSFLSEDFGRTEREPTPYLDAKPQQPIRIVAYPMAVTSCNTLSPEPVKEFHREPTPFFESNNTRIESTVASTELLNTSSRNAKGTVPPRKDAVSQSLNKEHSNNTSLSLTVPSDSEYKRDVRESTPYYNVQDPYEYTHHPDHHFSEKISLLVKQNSKEDDTHCSENPVVVSHCSPLAASLPDTMQQVPRSNFQQSLQQGITVCMPTNVYTDNKANISDLPSLVKTKQEDASLQKRSVEVLGSQPQKTGRIRCKAPPLIVPTAESSILTYHDCGQPFQSSTHVMTSNNQAKDQSGNSRDKIETLKTAYTTSGQRAYSVPLPVSHVKLSSAAVVNKSVQDILGADNDTSKSMQDQAEAANKSNTSVQDCEIVNKSKKLLQDNAEAINAISKSVQINDDTVLKPSQSTQDSSQAASKSKSPFAAVQKASDVSKAQNINGQPVTSSISPAGLPGQIIQPKSKTTTPLVQGNTTTPLVQGNTTTPLVQGKTTKPLGQGKTTTPLVQGNTTTPMVQGKTTPPLVQGNTPTPLVQGNTPTPLVQGNTTTLLVQGKTTKPLVQGNTTTPLVQGNITTPLVQANTTTPLVQANTTTPLVQANTTTPLVQGNTTTPMVQGKTTPPLVQGNTPTPLVQGNTPTPLVQGNTTTLLVQGKTTKPLVQGNTTTPLVQGNITTPLVQANTTTPLVQGKNGTPTIQSKTTTPTSQSKNTVPLVQSETSVKQTCDHVKTLNTPPSVHHAANSVKILQANDTLILEKAPLAKQVTLDDFPSLSPASGARGQTSFTPSGTLLKTPAEVHETKQPSKDDTIQNDLAPRQLRVSATNIYPVEIFENESSDSPSEHPGSSTKKKGVASGISSAFTTFFKSRRKSDDLKTSKPPKDKTKRNIFAKEGKKNRPKVAQGDSLEEMTPQQTMIPQQTMSPQQTLPPQQTRKSVVTSQVLKRCSPFGPYTVEGVCFLFVLTIFCLYLEMPIEKFVCYVLAAFYTFCIMRILGFLE